MASEYLQLVEAALSQANERIASHDQTIQQLQQALQQNQNNRVALNGQKVLLEELITRFTSIDKQTVKEEPKVITEPTITMDAKELV